MKPTLPALEVTFRRNMSDLIPIEQQVDELFRFCGVIKKFSPLLDNWLLASDSSKEDAYRYEAFDQDGPTTALISVLKTKYKKVKDIRTISFWNGHEKPEDGASIASRNNILGRPDNISLRFSVNPVISDRSVVTAWIEEAAKVWKPELVTFGPFWYDDDKVFPDRPGAGWMLYLPGKMTAQQVPEARALIPVKDNDKQIGTVIVSVLEAFDPNNSEHIKIANAIEVRLADQDLLPRYADL